MSLPIAWAPRAEPLAIRAAAARGEAAVALVARLRALPEHGLRGLGGPGWIVVIGDEPPWVDDLVYLGRDPRAPRLLLPTDRAPMVGEVDVTELLDRRVAAECRAHRGPYAVVPGWAILPLGAARMVHAPAWSP